MSLKYDGIAVGYIFALGATALWSGNFIVARGLTNAIPPVSLAFYRWLTAVLIFFPFAVRGTIREWGGIKQHLPYIAITAFLGITCFNTFIFSLVVILTGIFMANQSAQTRVGQTEKRMGKA